MPKKFSHYSKIPEVIQTISLCYALRFNEQETINKLQEKGYSFSITTLYKIKKKIRESLSQRVNDIYDYEMLEEHLAAIQAIKQAQRKIWELVDLEPEPYKKAEILTQFINTFPFLTQYYRTVKQVMTQHKTVKISPDITV